MFHGTPDSARDAQNNWVIVNKINVNLSCIYVISCYRDSLTSLFILTYPTTL